MGSENVNSVNVKGNTSDGNDMALTAEALKKRRVKIILLNLVYFIILLCISLVLFFKDAGVCIYLPVAAAVLIYILVVRRQLKSYEYDLRESILRGSVMKRLDNAVYDRRGGISYRYLLEAGFINAINSSSYLSRELIKGTYRGMTVELADVTFPIREDGLNKMFSGCLIHIEGEDEQFGSLDVRAGDTGDIPNGEEKRLVKKLGSFIPGSLYLHREGHTLDVLLRARFIGFQINPLTEISEKLLESDPLPELEQALKLAVGHDGRL